VLASVAREPALVIATPGAEPVADGGYTAVLLLDAWASLDLPVLDAPLEALRRWMAASALAREGRAVVLCGAPEAVALPAVEALVRWDPAWLAGRELAERRELGLPPAVRVAQLTGGRRALEEALEQADLPASAQVLGPVPLSHTGTAPGRRPAAGSDADRPPADHHVLVRVPAAETASLTRALLALKAFRSARKEADVVAIRIDPLDTF
jgi:primosomal protein N' (replication factor Y)